MSEQGQSLVYESGQWQVHLGRRELLASGVPVPIGARAFEIIAVLVRSAGDLVTKNDLMDRIWPGAMVGENTINVHISAIRKALGQDRTMLKTASGRGYRLVGDWTPQQPGSATMSAESPLMREREERPGTPLANNFPRIAMRLIGRDAAVRHVRDLVSAYRVVTLTGPGGIGKSSLAIEVARDLASGFDGDGWIVELASLSNPDLVPSTVAGALGLRLTGEVSPEAIARAIGAKRLLLVLDNCEHVIDTVANLAERLVHLCPHTTILATSREVLRIDGEYVYRVPPLEVPAADQEEPDCILGRGAVELFMARAKALDSDFVARAETLLSIGAICRHLDGIPLAIEFAAARAAMLGVQQVATGLRDRFALLTHGRRTALPRHRTLRAALDWSHELLPDVEQLLLRRMAIFPGGFTLEAAAAVMTDKAPDTAAMTDRIANLVSKSLIMLDASGPGTRWYLLETTRAYLLEKLAVSGEASWVARRQAEFCLALFAPFGTGGQLQAAIDDLGRYRVDIDNLRAALTWAFSGGDAASGRAVDGDTTLGVALAAAAADFWAAAGLMPEAGEWAGKALARIGNAAGTRLEMILRCSFGITLVFIKGMNDEAREALTRALTLAREFADFDYQQRVTSHLWMFQVRASALNDALAMAHQFEQVPGFGDAQSRVVLDFWVGITQVYRAAHVEAIERLRRVIDSYPIEHRAVDTIRFAGDFHAGVSGHISVSLLSRGLLDTASRSVSDAVEKARGTNSPLQLCLALAWAAGFVFLGLGDLESADGYGEELINHASKHAMRPFLAVGLCARGSVAVKRADLDTGVDLLRRGLTEMQNASYQLFYPFFVVELAAALGASGRVDEGLAEIDWVLRFAAETGHAWVVPEAFRVKGQLSAQRDPDDPEAEDWFSRGIEVAREQDALFWELRLALSQARAQVTRGRQQGAGALLASVYERFTEGFATADLRAARAMLDALPT